MFIVYTAPGCQPCKLTTKLLDDLNVPYEAKPLAENPDVIANATQLGQTQAPITVTPSGEFLSGFRPDQIREIVRADQREQLFG